MNLNRRDFIKKCLIVGSTLGFSNFSSIFSTFKNDQVSEVMRIDKDGKFGIGTSNPNHVLYLDGIPPLKFPDKGLVIWGQKTLQSGQMALDRIDARRLAIYKYKGI